MRRAPARLFFSLLAVALHLALEVSDELVDRRPDVARRLARAQGRTLREDRPLGHFTVMDRRVLLLRELHFHLRGLGELLLQLLELRLRVLAQRRGDLDVLALYLEPHRRLLGGRWSVVWSLPNGSREGDDVHVVGA